MPNLFRKIYCVFHSKRRKYYQTINGDIKVGMRLKRIGPMNKSCCIAVIGCRDELGRNNLQSSKNQRNFRVARRCSLSTHSERCNRADWTELNWTELASSVQSAQLHCPQLWAGLYETSVSSRTWVNVRSPVIAENFDCVAYYMTRKVVFTVGFSPRIMYTSRINCSRPLVTLIRYDNSTYHKNEYAIAFMGQLLYRKTFHRRARCCGRIPVSLPLQLQATLFTVSHACL